MTTGGGSGAQGAIAALWPAPASARPAWSPFGTGTDYLAVPSPRRPRLLVPVDVPGADRLLLRHGGGRRTRAGRVAWRTAQRSRLARWAPLPRLRVVAADDGIEAYLSQALGRAVRIGVLLGPDRANLKPVLALYPVPSRGDSKVLGFAKVATSAVTEPLLTAEAAALQQLERSPVPGVVVPRLLHHGAWRGRGVLVATALPLAQTGRRPARIGPEVVAGIARVGGLREQPLRQSAFWRQHSDSRLPSGWRSVDGNAWRRLVDAVPDVPCLLGSWHGDLGPWNAAQGDDHLEVWDWERFTSDVPAGMDAAHWPVQVALAAGAAASEAWPLIRRSVVDCLEALQRNESEAALVTAAYLVTVLDRYRHDAPETPTTALLTRVRWLLALADEVTSALHPESP
ncbi:MAG TPA: hypothetical protein VFL94_07980 [Actinomycetales bacterium]|nr:hypothetical protein [Actinomycetales bacterium]